MDDDDYYYNRVLNHFGHCQCACAETAIKLFLV